MTENSNLQQVQKQMRAQRGHDRGQQMNNTLHYTTLHLLLNYLINKEDEFENLQQNDKKIIISNLKRLDIYTNNINIFSDDKILELEVQYYAITQIYLSAYRIYLNKLTSDDFMFIYLNTKHYKDLPNDDEKKLQEFMSYFIKSLKNFLKAEK